MYSIFAYIYYKNQPNVGKYTMHGSSGIDSHEKNITNQLVEVNLFAMNFMTILQQLLCLWMLVLPKRISVLLTDRLLMAAACL